MVVGVGHNCVIEDGFPVYGCHPVGGSLVDGNVKGIYAAIGLLSLQ